MTGAPLRVLIVDDELPARDRLRRLLGAHADVTCIGEAGDGLAALAAVDALSPDLVLLDIQMPELDGLGVAAAIGAGGPRVIFTTAFEQHALRAFELAAVDYLLKPIERVRLAEALQRARAARQPAAEVARAVLSRLETRSRRMAVRCGAKYVVFDETRIAAVVAADHYAAILVDGRELLSDESLDRLALRLDPAEFMRVHRRAIVNVGFIRELQQEGDRRYVAILSDAAATRVPISRERLDALKARIGIV